jgi:hypothetical protein
MIKCFNTLHQRARAGTRGRQSKKMMHSNLNTSKISTDTKNNEEKESKTKYKLGYIRGQWIDI